MSAAGKYSFLDRIFHRIALGSSIVPRVSFDLERQAHLAAASGLQVRPTYVVGLARSGTTALLNLLYSSGNYSSSTYRHMPFPLAPNLWTATTSSAQRGSDLALPRAHGDGLTIDLNGVEGFEEVFWRAVGPTVYGPTFIRAGQVSEDVLCKYSDFQKLVVLSGKGDRYLSKNNNNVIRLADLSRDVSSIFLISFRDPIETAVSLLRQHARFSALQEKNPFILDYMNYLGHREFGLGHLPFEFAYHAVPRQYPPNSLCYWLFYWVAVYREILEATAPFESRVFFVWHNCLRSRAAQMTRRLQDLLACSPMNDGLLRSESVSSGVTDMRDEVIPGELRIEIDMVYQELRRRSQAIGLAN